MTASPPGEDVVDDRSTAIGIVCLGLLAGGALAVMGALAVAGQQIPASIAAAFGTAAGSLATLLTPRPPQERP
jgi:hypothetical protein